MNMVSSLKMRPLLSASLLFLVVMAGYIWLSPNPCDPSNKGPFDGKVLYSCTVEAVAEIHKGNLEPRVREQWLSKWSHRYDDSYMLKTPSGTLKAITEMMMSMNERFDYFYTPAETAEAAVGAAGELGGIGVQITVSGSDKKFGALFEDLPEFMTAQAMELLKEKAHISETFDAGTHLIFSDPPREGSPAFNAGIKAGDELLKVNGSSIIGQDMKSLVNALRGAPGTQLTLTIKSPSDPSPKNVHLVRQIIKLPPAAIGELRGDVGVMRIAGFESATTVQDVHNAIDAACDRKHTDAADTPCKASALIVDLRYNPGGRLDYVLETGELFLEKGVLTSVHMRQGDQMTRQDFNLTADAIKVRSSIDGTNESANRSEVVEFPSDRPIIVLVNKFTASGAEALAEMLQVNNRAVILGERTRGKGVGQCPIDLPFGYSMMPICMEYTIGDKSVDWVGVTPNIEVTIPDGTKEDLQMAKAMEIAHDPTQVVVGVPSENLDAVLKQRKAEFDYSQEKIRELLDL